MAIGLSSAILTLAENGDLQRINDKWLTKSTCSSEDVEIRSDRLHLESFTGLFLVLGITCFIALLLYSLQIIHRCQEATHADSISSEYQGRSHYRCLSTLLSVIDEKEDPVPSRRDHKRRKTEKWLTDYNNAINLVEDSNRSHSQISLENNINYSSNQTRMLR